MRVLSVATIALVGAATAVVGCRTPAPRWREPRITANRPVTPNLDAARYKAKPEVQTAAFYQPAGEEPRFLPPIGLDPPSRDEDENGAKKPDKEADKKDATGKNGDADAAKPGEKEKSKRAEKAAPPGELIQAVAQPKLPVLLHQAATANPEISAARNKARALMQRPPQVASLDDPVFSTTVFVVERVETAAGAQEGVFTLSQKFPWSGKLEARGEAAGHQAQAAFAELAGVELRIREEVKLAYYDLFYVQQADKIYRDLQQPLKDLLEVIVARYETNDAAVGRETILQAETRLDALQITLAQLTGNRSQAIARLSKAVNLPAAQLETILATPCYTPTPADSRELISRIEDQHPDLAARRSEVRRDRWLRVLACEDYKPDVTLGVSMVSIANQGISPVTNGEDAFALNLSFNLPVRNARRAAAVREATARITESARRFDNQLAELRSRVYQWREEVAAHDKVLEILNQRVISNAKETFELSVEAYQVDRVTFQQLISNYETLLRYQIERLTRLTQREQAIARLERAMGISAAAFTCSPTPPHALPKPLNNKPHSSTPDKPVDSNKDKTMKKKVARRLQY